LSRRDIERDAADGLDRPFPLAEVDVQVANREQRIHGHHPKVLRGSSASRTASPMKTSRLSISEITAKPESPSHGACRLFLPCDSSSPSDGEPGGRPKPRKSSAVSVVTEPPRMKGMKVSVATMALGRMCRRMTVQFETPRARAAVMYSKFRVRRNSARTTPTSSTHENSSNMPRSSQKLGASTLEMMSSR